MLCIRFFDAGDWREWRVLRLEALREAPDAFGSTLADWQGERDTEKRWRARLTEVPFNAVAELEGRPAGMVSATAPEENRTTTLISLWVAPFARGCGVGDALVKAVLRWAGQRGCATVELDVRETNESALALYRRHGFVDEGPVSGRPAGAPPERRMTRAVCS